MSNPALVKASEASCGTVATNVRTNVCIRWAAGGRPNRPGWAAYAGSNALWRLVITPWVQPQWTPTGGSSPMSPPDNNSATPRPSGGRRRVAGGSVLIMVGAGRFELPASWSQTRRATWLRHTPP